MPSCKDTHTATVTGRNLLTLRNEEELPSKFRRYDYIHLFKLKGTVSLEFL